jgi:photosystem II stability/assembly factor-like uncharacterized protein
MLVDPDELQALVQALIEEARQRARRRRRRRGALAVLALLAGVGAYLGLEHGGGSTSAAPPAHAGKRPAAAALRTADGWGPSHGPDGGSADAVAVAPSAPNVVYVGTSRGVFRSTNGGRSWTTAGPNRYLIPGVTSLLVDPRAPATVYAGLNWRWARGMSYYQRVEKTTDGGRTWHVLGLRGEPVAITRTAVYALTGIGRVVRSTDGGRTWQPASGGLPDAYVRGIAAAPSAPGTVYAAMGLRGVFASDDSGDRWRRVAMSARYGEVTAVAVDPLQPRTVYAATNAGIAGSTDGGRSWQLLNAAIGQHGHSGWNLQVAALVIDPLDPQTMFAATRCAGVFKSTDGGRRWSAANTGLEPGCPWAYAVALDPLAPRTVYAADPTRGVLRSIDGAAHWQPANDGLTLARIWALGISPRSPRTVYAATGPLGLFASTDGGVRWRSLAIGLHHAYAVAVDPNDPEHLLVAGSSSPGQQGPGRNGIASSSDGGRTWEAPTGDPRYVGVVAISGSTAYAATTNGDGIYGSSDGGRSWRHLGPPGVAYAQGLAVDPDNPEIVYAGAIGKTGGVYKSGDGGRSWQHFIPAVDVNAVVLDPADPSTVYAAASDGGVLESTDGGTTWQAKNAGLTWRVWSRHGKKWVTLPRPIAALAIDPARPTTLYALADPGGVYRTTDAGTSWRPANAGLGDREVTTLAFDPAGRTLYAGTADSGVVSLRP